MLTLKKYIVINGSPVLFPCDLVHADVAGNHTEQVESAGFFLLLVTPEGARVICSGESDSLSVSSRPEIDQQLISIYLGLHCN